MKHVQVMGVMVVLGLIAGCGDEEGGSDGPDESPAASFPRSFSGETETDYSYVNPGGVGLIRPGSPESDTALVTPNEDYTEVTVETDACLGTGTLSAISETDGRHLYALDAELVDCILSVQGSPAVLSDYGGSIAWGMDSLRFSVSGVATAGALGDSLFIIEFESF